MKQGYFKEFYTKREFLKWVEENINDIDFEYDQVVLEYYLKEDEEDGEEDS